MKRSRLRQKYKNENTLWLNVKKRKYRKTTRKISMRNDSKPNQTIKKRTRLWIEEWKPFAHQFLIPSVFAYFLFMLTNINYKKWCCFSVPTAHTSCNYCEWIHLFVRRLAGNSLWIKGLFQVFVIRCMNDDYKNGMKCIIP